MCLYVPVEVNRGWQNSEAGVTNGREPPCGGWGSNLSLLQEQHEHWTTEPSFSPQEHLSLH